jgi:hypothetical protein
MKSVTMWLPARLEKQALDLTLCIIRHFAAVDDKITRNHAIRMSLTGFDLGAQQSCEKMRVFWSGQQARPQWIEHSPWMAPLRSVVPGSNFLPDREIRTGARYRQIK